MEKFEIGDVVELNSGSPWMTVAEVSGEKIVLNYWNEKEDRLGGVETTPDKFKLFRRIDIAGT